MTTLANIIICLIPAGLLCGLLVIVPVLLAIFYKIVFGIPFKKTMEELGW